MLLAQTDRRAVGMQQAGIDDTLDACLLGGLDDVAVLRLARSTSLPLVTLL
jgi:hypothetical protein